MRVVLVVAALAPRPASAVAVRVPTAPAADTYGIVQRGDTLVAGADHQVHRSLDGGATWTASAMVGPVPVSVDGVWVERGRLWAGTYGQGVFTSDDLGASWQPASAGLAGGVAGSHLYITGFVSRGDSLYAATDGAGVFVRSLSVPGAWSGYGAATLVTTTSGSVATIARGGSRLLVGAEANGAVHTQAGAAAVWSRVPLDPGSPSAGTTPFASGWSGSEWWVSTQGEVYRSATATSDWVATGPGSSQLGTAALAVAGPRVFVSYSSLSDVEVWTSPDAGASWELLAVWPTYIAEMVLRDSVLHMARGDGVWRLSTATLAVGGPGGPSGLALALAGPHPARDRLRVRYTLPAAGPVTLSLHDVSGSRLATLARGGHAAGEHAAAADLAAVPVGLHFLRLETPFGTRSLRVTRLR
jgi:hypothetical protein